MKWKAQSHFGHTFSRQVLHRTARWEIEILQQLQISDVKRALCLIIAVKNVSLFIFNSALIFPLLFTKFYQMKFLPATVIDFQYKLLQYLLLVLFFQPSFLVFPFVLDRNNCSL